MSDPVKKTWVENTIYLDTKTDLIIVVEHEYSKNKSEGLKIHTKNFSWAVDPFHPLFVKIFKNEFEAIGSW
jgi:hypothetical protein